MMNALRIVNPTFIRKALSPERQHIFKALRFHHSTVMQERATFSNDFFFRQMFDDVSCTYTYLLGDVVSKKAILIDPGWVYNRS